MIMLMMVMKLMMMMMMMVNGDDEYYISSIGFCKITLEVLSSNHPAKQLYAGAGFAPYELDPMAGHALFWQKKIQN